MPVALNMNDFNLDLYPSYAKMSFIDEIFEKYLKSEKCPLCMNHKKIITLSFPYFQVRLTNNFIIYRSMIGYTDDVRTDF